MELWKRFGGRVHDDFLACDYRVANDSENRFRLFVDALLAIGLTVFLNHSFSSFRLVSAPSIRPDLSAQLLSASDGEHRTGDAIKK